MLRILLASLTLGLTAAGCGSPSPQTPAQRTAEMSQAAAQIERLLPWDSTRKDVTVLESGIEYVVINRGDAEGTSPVASDRVRVHYEGRLATGEKFDSSLDRGSPSEFRLDQVIPGWTIGLQEMRPGDEFVFFIPNRLAYGQQARGNVIKAGDDLVFYVKLLEIVAPKVTDSQSWSRYLPWQSDLPEVVRTGSGLEYIILASGDPDGSPARDGQMVMVHYEGRLAATGEAFDSSFERGNPEIFPSNALIPGWVEALAVMKPGDRWMLYIPAALAYGETGTPGGPIPPDAALQFEVELIDVLR